MLTVLLTGVVAVLVFGTVVLVHEAGHFLAARRCGIYVQNSLSVSARQCGRG